jgi:hypothetical protein
MARAPCWIPGPGVTWALIYMEGRHLRTGVGAALLVAALQANGQAAGLLADAIRVTEIMYNSADGAEFDFLELHNRSTSPVSLAGAQFSEGITFTFPPGSTLPAGGYALVSRSSPTGNFSAFRSLYGLGPEVLIYGPYSGNLSDSGETVTLLAPGGVEEIFSISYSDDRGWPVAADGAGHSLVPRQDFENSASAFLAYGRNWRHSAHVRGSPGGPDPEPLGGGVMLNEITAHTDFTNQFDSNDWIELTQLSDETFTFGPGWYLSDNDSNLRRWQIPPGTQIPPRGFVVFDEVTGVNNPPGSGFGINKGGEAIYLSYFPEDGPGGVVDAISFEGQENDWSLARVPDGSEYWDQVTPRTRGSANASAPPRVVISEIFYQEDGVVSGGLPPQYMEYVEIHNATGQPAQLYTQEAVWRIAGGIDFDMPVFLTLAADERIVVVAFDPVTEPLAGFRQIFNVPENVRFFGPFTGRLANDTDRISLQRAQAPDQAGDPLIWVIVDEVEYLDRAPWPRSADQEGDSLNRRSATAPGNNPASWFAAVPNPGQAPPASNGDADNDGMDDAWELANGLDPSDPGDADLDPDEDGMSNLDEFLAGTDPRDARSALRISGARVAGPGLVEFQFQAAAGRAYVVEASPTVSGGTWAQVETVPAGEARTVTIQAAAPAQGEAQFHRVRLP